jgi:hypothetical protein
MNILRLNDINGVLETRLNILHCEIGVIIPNNGFKRNRFADQFENCLHGNARPCNTRFPKMDFGADLNSIHRSNLHDSEHRSQGAAFRLTTQLPNNQPEAGARGARQKKPSRAKGHLNCFRIGLGQSVAQLTGHSARSSGVDGAIKGLIVVNLNGEGRGVACRAIKPNGKT